MGPVVLILYCLIAFASIFFVAGTNFPIVLKPGLHHINYPHSGANYVVAISFILMLVFVILSHFLLLRKTKGLKRAFWTIIIILVFFGGIEFSLRRYIHFNPTRYRPHPDLIWELQSTWRDGPIKINSMGLHYEEFPATKEKDEFRFILLGDSSAYGTLVKDHERFSHVLEQKLRLKYPDKKIRVINGAAEGYTVFQGRTLYDLKLRQLEPDGLIIAFNNDPCPDVMSDKERVPSEKLRRIFRILYKSELFLFLKKLVMYSKAGNIGRPGSRAQNIDQPSTWRVSEEDIRKHYNYLIEDIERRGGRSIIISMPLLDDEEEDPSSETMRYRDIIEEISDKTGSVYLDIFRQWRREEGWKKLFADNMHPNAEGHKRIAETLYEAIVRENIVK